MHPFDDFVAWLKGPLWAFVKVIFEGAIERELEMLAPIALSAVSAVAADPSLLTGSAKRDAAFKAIGQQMAAAGLSAAASSVNLAIELAVQNLKAGK